MILTQTVTIKIAPNNYTYWKSKGYDVRPTGGRGGKNTGQSLEVKVSDLLPKSCVTVRCRCDRCGEEYDQRFSRDIEVCYPCRKTEQMQGNILGKSNLGRKIPSMTGPNHPRWNPNKELYKRFLYQVQRLTEETYFKNIDIINPERHIRTLCGVEGGYQLDHKISIKSGFELGMSPLELADISNLQMLPWETNRNKWHR
jgi:ribosomal protein L37AE/L43A